MSIAINPVILCTVAAMCAACASQPAPAPAALPAMSAVAGDDRPVEAVAFSGKLIYRTPAPADQIARADADIAALESKPELSEADYIRLAEMHVSVGRFQDAIGALSRGLAAHPESYKLRRHRGHRLINVREIERAIVDLNEAVALMKPADNDVVEYRADGQPNGTYEHWIWYHIGLYHYLKGDYAIAAAAYQRCVDTATNVNHRIGATDWLWNAWMNAGEPAKAQAAIDAIPADIAADAQQSYYKRVMLYKGATSPEGVLDASKPGKDWTGGDITTGYGVANWLRHRGDAAGADAILAKILETPFWSAWAYVAADRDLSRRS
jgi:tetratricopeptide (TPR) repeat protein